MLNLNRTALSTGESHPAQLDAFIRAYRYLLEIDVKPESVIFMGDSAGGMSLAI